MIILIIQLILLDNSDAVTAYIHHVKTLLELCHVINFLAIYLFSSFLLFAPILVCDIIIIIITIIPSYAHVNKRTHAYTWVRTRTVPYERVNTVKYAYTATRTRT